MTREEAARQIYGLILSAEDEDGPCIFSDQIEALETAIEVLKQPEIIRCKDCIHSSGVKMVDGWTYCAEGRLLVKYENGYCSDARRREE